MEGLRLKPDIHLSNFALLGYPGAKLPSDGFSIIHPFNDAKSEVELILEAAGFRHIQKNHDNIHIDDTATFAKKFNGLSKSKPLR